MDLHVHTCLSPCGEDEMLPSQIAGRAVAVGLDAVGIADHNSAANVGAVRQAGERLGLTVVGGMEVTSREEVHVLAFFDSDEALLDMQELVYDNLPGENDAVYFGPQWIVDEHGRRAGENPRLLIGSTDLSLDRVVGEIHHRGGLAVASHVDRDSFSVISQLGFMPPDVPFDAVEVSPRAGADYLDRVLGQRPGPAAYGGLPVLTASDAHRLDDIGRSVTRLVARSVSVDELRKALGGNGGRRIAGNHE